MVVFNFPAGDTLTKERDSQDPYYDILRREEAQMYNVYRNQIQDEAQLKATSYQQARNNVWDQFTIATRPVDKRENYIKRCVAIAGDTISIKNGILHVNNEEAFVSPTSATDYYVTTSKVISEDQLREAGINLNSSEESPDFDIAGNNAYRINLTASEVEILKKIPGVDSVSRVIADNYGAVFPMINDLTGR